MNELEKKYQQKQEALNGVKSLFYTDRRLFKKHFFRDTFHNQTNMLAFLQINDSSFYHEVYNYLFGE